MEDKDFEELQSIKADELPKSASYDNFRNMGDKNLDTEFGGLIDRIKVWKHGNVILLKGN